MLLKLLLELKCFYIFPTSHLKKHLILDCILHPNEPHLTPSTPINIDFPDITGGELELDSATIEALTKQPVILDVEKSEKHTKPRVKGVKWAVPGANKARIPTEVLMAAAAAATTPGKDK